jgi:hypothetical protein
MQARRLLRLLLILVLPVAPAGTAPVAASENVITAPRQSVPAPVHDESTCALCQSTAFAPYAAPPACGLIEALGSERRELPSRNDRLTHSGSLRPPRSRDPPALRDG